MPQLRAVFIAIGDSGTEGFRVYDGRNWPYLMQRFARWQSYDFAVCQGQRRGRSWTGCPLVESVVHGAVHKVAVVFGGYNDHLPAYNISATETVCNLALIVSRLKAAGYTVAIIDEAQTGGPPCSHLRRHLTSSSIFSPPGRPLPTFLITRHGPQIQRMPTSRDMR
ncbi:SGNH/GDSL hydrolase family protein [Komagataeibacter diospyri]|uniref:SGNH/GDSL hydrolase family protein n=1 Tax=Komagataeibacter diospyri TaxID=1932662 RepID=UPI00375817D7